MVDVLQWLMIALLTGLVGWLLYDRYYHRIPDWLQELDRDDILSRSELDQYHLYVIQTAQTQREMIESRLAQYQQKSMRMDESPLPVIEREESIPISDGASETIPFPLSPPENFSNPTPLPDLLVVNLPDLGVDPLSLDPANRALLLWNEGRNYDQIAQELRIGRQEAQLLIRMAQRRPATLVRM
jgi:hypothetical protein